MIPDYQYMRELFISCLNVEYRHVENGGSFAYVRDGDVLYLFFEKSNGEEDWYNNLSYHAVSVGREGDGWFCHEGFLRVWQSILPYLAGQIQSMSVRRIVSVGYSHGAALALLCHEYIWYARPDLDGNFEGYGFGCPRVIYGRVAGEGERWHDFFVVRNIDDSITHLPPRIFGYRHVGNLIEIGRRGEYSGINAHRAENYVRELEKTDNNGSST
jgi:hypothetical protein